MSDYNSSCQLIDEVQDQDNEVYVGYGDFKLNIIMICISILGIIINSIFSSNYIKQIINSTGIGVSIIILSILAITETFISICWLINNSFIMRQSRFEQNCDFCKGLAHAESFLYLFEWIISSLSLYEIKIIIINPKKILGSGKRIIRNLIISFIISFISMIIGIVVEIGGISPLLTCFIIIPEREWTIRNIYFLLYFLIPLGCLIFGVCQFVLIKKSDQYKKEKKQRLFFKEYSYFVITYIASSIILILTYVLDYILTRKKRKPWSLFITVVTFISCSSPLIIGVIRFYRTELAKKLINKCIKKSPEIIDEKNELMLSNNAKMEGGLINKLEKDMLSNLVIKHFIAISFCIGKSKYFNYNENENDEYDKNERADYKINKQAILKDLDLSINDDIIVLEETNLDIEVIEYNTSTFKKLRELEGITEDFLVSVFQPKEGIINLIKKNSGNLYINSTNKLFALKSISSEELSFYQTNVLPDIYNYLSNNKNSIIQRVFGLFQIKIDNQEIEYMALVYNTYEILNNDLFFKAKDNNDKIVTIDETTFKRSIDNDNEDNQMLVERKNTFNTKKKSSIINLTNNEKTFKINLSKEDNENLNEIVDQDINFLKGVGINGYKFLICEKNVQKIELNLTIENESKSSGSGSKNEKSIENIKKYLFNSNLDNDVIYSIAIIDTFKFA